MDVNGNGFADSVMTDWSCDPDSVSGGVAPHLVETR